MYVCVYIYIYLYNTSAPEAYALIYRVFHTPKLGIRIPPIEFFSEVCRLPLC